MFGRFGEICDRVSGRVVLTNAHSSLGNAGMSLAGVKVLKAEWKTDMANHDGEELQYITAKPKLWLHIKHAMI